MFFEIDAWGSPVGQGVTGARYCTIEGVAKVDGAQTEYGVVNEAICGRLAFALGLPVPPGAVVTTQTGSLAYVAWRFGPKGQAPPPVIPDELATNQPAVAAGIVAFDCWVHNFDRHPGNLAYSAPDIPPAIFDHERALLGVTRSPGAVHLNAYRDLPPQYLGCLAPHLPTRPQELREWVAIIGAVTDRFIDATVRSVVRPGGLDALEAAATASFLSYRRDRLLTMLQSAMATVNPGAAP